MKKSLLWLITGFILLTSIAACAPVLGPHELCDKLCFTKPSNWDSDEGREAFIALVKEVKSEYKINSKDRKGRTALHFAAKYGHPESVRILLEAGAEVDIVATYKTPLHYAIEGDNGGAIKLLLDAGAEMDTYMLHNAAESNSPEAIKALVDGGADINVRYGNREDGKTPLHTAAHHGTHSGEMEALKALIDLGADVNALEGFNYQLLEGLNYHNQTRGTTPLHMAASGESYKTPEMIKTLLAAGADVNVENQNRATPLHWAARSTSSSACNDDPESIKILLAAGANVNARDRRSETPLHKAAIFGCSKIIEALIAAGADIEATDLDERTALHFAAAPDTSRPRPEHIKTLLAAGANVNPRDSRGQTPLATIIQRRHVIRHNYKHEYDKTIIYLLSAGGIQ